MIDLDLLDEQLEQALTHEVRVLRGTPPRRTSPPPSPPRAPVAEQAASPEWDLEWDGPAPTTPAATATTTPPPPPPKPEPEPELARPATAERPADPSPSRPRPAPSRPAPSRPAATRRFDKPLAPFEKRFDEPSDPRRERPTVARSEPRPSAPPTERTAGARSRPRPADRQSERPFEREAERPFERQSERPFERAARAARSSSSSSANGTPLERLRQAAAALSGPDGAPRDLAIVDHARLIPDLVARGEMPTADQHMATHAALTAERGITEDRADAAAWDAMRALLDGRRDDARDGVDAVRRLGERARAADAAERTWALRFWVGLEWGDAGEQCELLDHCRERAYRYNDLPWRAALTMQLARMGRTDEATREFDAVAAHLKSLPRNAITLDILTNLAEAAFYLRDKRRASLVEEPIMAAKVSLVTVGRAWVCKGSVARFAAHVAAAKGEWDDADRYFAAAMKTHRRIHAEPLVARTLYEWGTTLLGRDDDLAHQHLDESAELASRLRLNGIAPVAA
ncbi:MAG: hypothetical protein ACRD2W_09885 [Acidimicrobiales bacterium]